MPGAGKCKIPKGTNEVGVNTTYQLASQNQRKIYPAIRTSKISKFVLPVKESIFPRFPIW